MKLLEYANVQIPEVAPLEEENHKLQSEIKKGVFSLEAWRHKEMELEIQITALQVENTLETQQQALIQPQASTSQ